MNGNSKLGGEKGGQRVGKCFSASFCDGPEGQFLQKIFPVLFSFEQQQLLEFPA